MSMDIGKFWKHQINLRGINPEQEKEKHPKSGSEDKKDEQAGNLFHGEQEYDANGAMLQSNFNKAIINGKININQAITRARKSVVAHNANGSSGAGSANATSETTESTEKTTDQIISELETVAGEIKEKYFMSTDLRCLSFDCIHEFENDVDGYIPKLIESYKNDKDDEHKEFKQKLEDYCINKIQTLQLSFEADNSAKEKEIQALATKIENGYKNNNDLKSLNNERQAAFWAQFNADKDELVNKHTYNMIMDASYRTELFEDELKGRCDAHIAKLLAEQNNENNTPVEETKKDENPPVEEEIDENPVINEDDKDDTPQAGSVENPKVCTVQDFLSRCNTLNDYIMDFSSIKQDKDGNYIVKFTKDGQDEYVKLTGDKDNVNLKEGISQALWSKYDRNLSSVDDFITLKNKGFDVKVVYSDQSMCQFEFNDNIYEYTFKAGDYEKLVEAKMITPKEEKTESVQDKLNDLTSTTFATFKDLTKAVDEAVGRSNRRYAQFTGQRLNDGSLVVTVSYNNTKDGETASVQLKLEGSLENEGTLALRGDIEASHPELMNIMKNVSPAYDTGKVYAALVQAKEGDVNKLVELQEYGLKVTVTAGAFNGTHYQIDVDAMNNDVSLYKEIFTYQVTPEITQALVDAKLI